MEVCGTHTMSIFRYGIRSVLPKNITLLSGPGCPVCVTSQGEIDAFIELSRKEDVILCTFGDLIRVPGSSSSLKKELAAGRDIRTVYSPLDAVKVAEENPGKNIVFPGIGFETTAPAVAVSVMTASQKNIDNFFVCSAHKLVPPALETLMTDNKGRVDGFILPGHVSVIIGTEAYRPFFDKYKTPCTVTGFEPVDILKGILNLVLQITENRTVLDNEYKRAVSAEGNRKALQLLNEVFDVRDTVWRGLGTIKNSGLKISRKYEKHDAAQKFNIKTEEREVTKGCICGDILTGIKIPPDCPLYNKTCTPMDPAGPCMVSTEGTCAAYYRFDK